ncbi:MAG: dolichyl-phosphate-mannose--protein mannosyltransferase [Chloroflexi bacterium]|nr:dolichyl-phosphate-mannose--protein mannosyltransferase [Chloroflexota bacterium]
MSAITKQTKVFEDDTTEVSDRSMVKVYTTAGLGLIILLGAFLRFYELGAYSIGNTYYAATVKSMLTSWDNFFYAAFEPGGSVTVDKPPLGFWVQAVSAYFLGVNGFSLALPQALAGVISIPVLYALVKRHFGVFAGLTAALVLATVPVTVVTERNNTIDGLLVLTLLLAAWAFIIATETGKLRHLLLGAVLVGLGFNIKMLQAFMPLPAFYAIYFFGSKTEWWKRIVNLCIATVVLLVVSLSWAVVVDLTPAENRPYIGSSSNNTVMELIVGHNGLSRLGISSSGPDGGNLPAQDDGQGFGPPQDGGQNQRPQQGVAPSINDGQVGGFPGQGSVPQDDGQLNNFPAPQNGGQPGQTNFNDGQPDGGGPGGDGAGGGRNSEVGTAGLFRMFTEPLATEASWLLPFALLGIPLALLALGWSWPLNDKFIGLILWAGWLLPALAYFSFTSGLFHSYYLIMLGPALGALVGITAWSLVKLWKQNHWLGWGLLLALSGITVLFEIYTMSSYPDYAGWVALICLAAWLAGIGLLALRTNPLVRNAAITLVFVALLTAPLTWSIVTTLNTNPNVALPASGVDSGQNAPPNAPNVTIDDENDVILDYLLANTDPDSYLVATLSARQAAPYILETGRAVLTFGGFTGSDNVVSVEQFVEMVYSGELQYVLGLPQQKQEIASWMTQNCSLVELPGVSSLQSDFPSVGNLPGGQQGQSEVLYDCAS